MIIVETWESKFNATIKFLIIVTIFLVINFQNKMNFDYSLILIMNGVFLLLNILPIKYVLLFDNNKYFLKDEEENITELPFDKKIGKERIIMFLKKSHNYKILFLTILFNIMMIIASKYIEA